ncbi:DUF4007 family protein [Chloroflexus sp.]|uniref:DUF4007 family protein n=1 Tax=Chloroflexus sp. TaxID=1904827 RepID=UPI002601AF85|nr:DUF4007 family protein [uncultured Chloroflexus sp.]
MTRSFIFSGHETFTLRSNWLKKAFDLLRTYDDLFSREDAFVLLGVGKNMAQSIRFWGLATGLFERVDRGEFRATQLGTDLLADDGWDPFLVTPTGRWLIHYQLVARSNSPFTWYYTFNLLKRGEFTGHSLRNSIIDYVSHRSSKIVSESTLDRDIDCMLRCYIRPNITRAGASQSVEEVLHCPLHDLGLLQALPDQRGYQLTSGLRADVPDELVVLAARNQAISLGRSTLSFNDLAYGEKSPGRIFRFDEDSLLSRLFRFEEMTNGLAAYSDSGGIRQIVWRNLELLDERTLLVAAFDREKAYV